MNTIATHAAETLRRNFAEHIPKKGVIVTIGTVGLAKLPTRAQDSLLEWVFDGDDEDEE